MARVYGKLQMKPSGRPLEGEIVFEPKPLAYLMDGRLWASAAYIYQLDVDGSFDLDMMPGEYYVHMHNAVVEVEVPMVNEIGLKELLEAKYNTT